jgi:integrase
MLQDLPRDSIYIIAGKFPDRPRSDLKRPWVHLTKAAELDNARINDLRRTFGLQITQSSGLHFASKLLRHSDVRVTEQHYAPLDINEQRKALEMRKRMQKG